MGHIHLLPSSTYVANELQITSKLCLFCSGLVWLIWCTSSVQDADMLHNLFYFFIQHIIDICIVQFLVTIIVSKGWSTWFRVSVSHLFLSFLQLNAFFLRLWDSVTSFFFMLLLGSCKASRKECASYMVGLPVTFRYEYLMAETIFSQVKPMLHALLVDKIMRLSYSFGCTYSTILQWSWQEMHLFFPCSFSFCPIRHSSQFTTLWLLLTFVRYGTCSVDKKCSFIYFFWNFILE